MFARTVPIVKCVVGVVYVFLIQRITVLWTIREWILAERSWSSATNRSSFVQKTVFRVYCGSVSTVLNFVLSDLLRCTTCGWDISCAHR